LEFGRIQPIYWLEKLRGDFRKGHFWNWDTETGKWRLLFSDLMLSCAAHFEQNSKKPGDLFYTQPNTAEVKHPRGGTDEPDKLEDYEKRAMLAQGDKALVQIYLEAFGSNCKTQAKFIDRCTKERRPVKGETIRRYLSLFYSEMRR
jgi:hypothetical protein